MGKPLAVSAGRNKENRRQKKELHSKNLDFVLSAEEIAYTVLKRFARNVQQKSMQTTSNAKIRRETGNISMIEKRDLKLQEYVSNVQSARQKQERLNASLAILKKEKGQGNIEVASQDQRDRHTECVIFVGQKLRPERYVRIVKSVLPRIFLKSLYRMNIGERQKIQELQR